MSTWGANHYGTELASCRRTPLCRKLNTVRAATKLGDDGCNLQRRTKAGDVHLRVSRPRSSSPPHRAVTVRVH
jgi:hypothetical protein